MSTVRFTRIVAEAGKPVEHLLLVAPERDTELQRALKAGRVLTVHPEGTGSATVGFDSKAPGQILLFPRSLRAFAGKRIVGIKYDLFAETAPEPKAKTPRKKEKTPPSRKESRPKEPAAPPPAPGKVIAFPEPEAEEEADPEAMRAAIRRAVRALEKGNAVAAYNLLKEWA